MTIPAPFHFPTDRYSYQRGGASDELAAKLAALSMLLPAGHKVVIAREEDLDTPHPRFLISVGPPTNIVKRVRLLLLDEEVRVCWLDGFYEALFREQVRGIFTEAGMVGVADDA